MIRLLLIVCSLSFALANVGIVFSGRSDQPSASYEGLVQAIKSALKPDGIEVFVSFVTQSTDIPAAITTLKSQSNVTRIFLAGHSMTSGGQMIQKYAHDNPAQANGVILLSSFLQRVYRPDVAACLPKASIQPKVDFSHLLGYLQDGAHDCYGSNTVSFPLPVLTVGGELDGVVRITRIAEAYYTQAVLTNAQQKFPVVVIPGMNHAQFYNGTALPTDLEADVSTDVALSSVAKVVRAFIIQITTGVPFPADILNASKTYFQPIVSAFVEKEGSWFFTGGDDEHGSSPWAAQAQEWMAEPLPDAWTWTVSNQFRLVSDEEKIPPYYRPKHRPEGNVTGSRAISSSTVSQLRFIELTVTETKAGLDGWAIIKEEKLNILTALPDDGSVYVSAIEIATKLFSRQKAYNITGYPSPASLDDGDRCKPINQKAYDWALQAVSPEARQRFLSKGFPLEMVADEKPNPPAGPWWIWTYLGYNKAATSLQIKSYYAFYSLDADPYGAGNHYCKLLSPARALEYILVDGLRKQ